MDWGDCGMTAGHKLGRAEKDPHVHMSSLRCWLHALTRPQLSYWSPALITCSDVSPVLEPSPPYRRLAALACRSRLFHFGDGDFGARLWEECVLLLLYPMPLTAHACPNCAYPAGAPRRRVGRFSTPSQEQTSCYRSQSLRRNRPRFFTRTVFGLPILYAALLTVGNQRSPVHELPTPLSTPCAQPRSFYRPPTTLCTMCASCVHHVCTAGISTRGGSA